MKVTKKEVISYEGNCPECGQKQESDNEKNVDRVCWRCTEKQEKKKQEELKKELQLNIIGSTIEKVDYSYDSLPYDITILCNNGKKYRLEFGADTEYDSPTLTVDIKRV